MGHAKDDWLVSSLDSPVWWTLTYLASRVQERSGEAMPSHIVDKGPRASTGLWGVWGQYQFPHFRRRVRCQGKHSL